MKRVLITSPDQFAFLSDPSQEKGEASSDFEIEVDGGHGEERDEDSRSASGSANVDAASCDEEADDDVVPQPEIEDPSGLVEPFDRLRFQTPRLTPSISEFAEEQIEEEARRFIRSTDIKGIMGRYMPHPEARAFVVSPNFCERQNVGFFEREFAEVSSTSRAISGELRRVLTSRSLSRTLRDQEKGRLDRRKLHTLNLPGRKPRKRIFTKTIPGIDQRVGVGVLVDQSGSMHGVKSTCAQRAAIALGEALSSLEGIGVRFFVHGFYTRFSGALPRHHHKYDRYSDLYHVVYKSTEDKWKRVRARLGAMESNRRAANADNESVRISARSLLDMDNVDRRVLFVLSDGAPQTDAGRGPDRIREDTKLAVRQCSELGIEMIGIGIKSDDVADFYPNWFEIDNPRDLEGKLLSSVQKLFNLGRVA